MSYGHNLNPFDKKKYSQKDILNATTLSDESLKNGMCPKSRGDMLTCIDCPDEQCTVGRKVRELMEKETAAQPAPPKKQDSYAEDIEQTIYINAVNSGEPIRSVIQKAVALSEKPSRFTKREAEKFLYHYRETHPDQETDMTLEESIEKENRKNYNEMMRRKRQYKEGEITDEGLVNAFAKYIATVYGLRDRSAVAYVYSLIATFGDEPEEVQTISEQEQPPPETGVIKETSYNEMYERLMDALASLQEQYSERVDLINEHIDLNNRMIEMYNGMIQQIQEAERKHSHYPEVESQDLVLDMNSLAPDLDESQDDMEPIIDEEENEQ